MQLPLIPVYANSTARPYDVSIDAIRKQLSQHLLSPVEFVGQINAMYNDGARIFLEVGPKSILTKLVGQILEGRNHTVVSLDGQGGGLRGLLIALGTLAVKGVGIKLTALFEGRDVQALDLSKLLESTQKPKLPATTWLINGGGARPISEKIAYPGKLPPLSLETATEAKRNQNTAPAPLPEKEQPTMTNLVHQSTTPLPMSTPTPETGASQPVVPNYHRSEDAALIAYQSYQQTMRQFLSLQEQVMMQFLGSGQIVSHQAAPTAPMISPTQPTLANGNGVVTPPPTYQPANGKHNGNGNGMAHTAAPMSTPKPIAPPVVEPVRTQNVVPVLDKNVEPVRTQNVVPVLDKTNLTQTLLQLVSDRTGYPIEMLGLDQDMEAELGIDSIKRVEILGALQKTLPQTLATSIQSKMESLTRVKSLNGIVEQLLTLPTTGEETRLGKFNNTESPSGAM
jgi:acyl transferase domain-containing protein